ncbi:hypothetical protein U9M48_021778 [Paspalum notatum var. saurae]|uniref:Pectinesterase catalytic domain-containing protein n=1 Tax=Paspalum notatum var. saurae TaxID=547442 RepID=A0AAQ3TJR5_PASNO
MGTTFPSWLSEHDRRLLVSPATDTVTPEAVVALDGSGTHRSINKAVAAVTAPVRRATTEKVIYVKAGRCQESVSISYRQEGVMLMGDGKGKTIIEGHKSVAAGYTTYSSSATVVCVDDAAAMGAGFIAKG